MSVLDDFTRRGQERHDVQVAAGEHDGLREYGPRFCESFEHIDGSHAGIVYIHMCHCSKRRREALGNTALPGPVEWQSPSCPTCYQTLEGDGEYWACAKCCVEWGGSGETARWSDVYGDLGVPVVAS
jgi:hypothetical protein